jgi:hypothetical protein
MEEINAEIGLTQLLRGEYVTPGGDSEKSKVGDHTESV